MVGQPAKLEIDGHEDRMHLRLSGDLDLAGIDPLRRALLHHVHTATRPITLDTRAITYLSSAGVGLLLEAITVADGQLALLIDPDTAAGRILSLTGLERWAEREKRNP
jgi:anti-anti-sigma factor